MLIFLLLQWCAYLAKFCTTPGVWEEFLPPHTYAYIELRVLSTKCDTRTFTVVLVSSPEVRSTWNRLVTFYSGTNSNTPLDRGCLSVIAPLSKGCRVPWRLRRVPSAAHALETSRANSRVFVHPKARLPTRQLIPAFYRGPALSARSPGSEERLPWMRTVA